MGNFQTSKPRQSSPLTERDRLLLGMLLRSNTQWLITTHNGHITRIQQLDQGMDVGDMPGWWFDYLRANSLLR